MPRASLPTLLPLSTYARFLGLDPLHFCQARSTVRPEPRCSDVWFQYDWQYGDRVGRETLARVIGEAERDIADELGYWPAPVWIEQERQLYPHPHRADLYGYGYDPGLNLKRVHLNYGHVLAGGVRATELLGTADTTESTFIDRDSDDFDEWAVYTLSVDSGLDACEVKAYFSTEDRTDPGNTGADPRWEIRPIKASVSGTTLTIYVHSWELLKPDLQEAVDAGINWQAGKPEPATGEAIDADQLENYVESIELYRVYTDTSDQVLFGWGSSGCTEPTCAYVTQSGCFRMHNARLGLVTPEPATYENGCFTSSTWTEGVEPDYLWVNYRSGDLPRRSLDCNELDDYWTTTIMILATARLDRPLCNCSNINQRVDRWRADMAHIKSNPDGTGDSYVTDPAVFANPFGTRIGEYEAWKRVHKGRGRQLGRAVKV